LNIIENWLDDLTISQTPIVKTATSLLQDYYLNPKIIENEPEDIACACIVLTFQIYGLKLPGVEDTDTWYKAFCPKLQIDHVWEIIDQILKVYELESEIY
jgi:cyclin-Q